MEIEKKEEFIKRIISVSENDKAGFGQMNVFQMICHCADQFRIMFGEIDGLRRQDVDVAKLREMAMRKETVPTVDGLDQVAGKGTKPTSFEKDKEILISYLNRFYEVDEKYKFSFHPYYGDIDKSQWERLIIHHLDHHLNQFGR
jgi:hypothetical protein